METEIEYIWTAEMIQGKIDNSGYVCDQCGGELSPIETFDNADNPTHWCGCMKCQRFTNGVEKEAYEAALILLDEHRFEPCKRISWNFTYSESDEDLRKRNISTLAQYYRVIKKMVLTTPPADSPTRRIEGLKGK